MNALIFTKISLLKQPHLLLLHRNIRDTWHHYETINRSDFTCSYSSFDFKTVKINNGLIEPLSLLVTLSNYILRSVVIYFKETPIEYLTLL